MQHWDSDPPPWYIVPVKPELEARSRRWNLAIILILAAIVVGSFVGLISPRTSDNTVHHAPTRVHQPPPVHTPA